MKKLIPPVAACVALSFFLTMQGCREDQATPPIVSSGDLSDLEAQFDDLINGTPLRASIVIDLAGTDDFIQFANRGGVVEVDFPVFTDRQKEREPVFREICGELGMTVRETIDPEGNRFLDAEIGSDSGEVAEKADQFLKRLFGADEATALDFTLHPLAQ